jgi:hypothetical protein
LVLFLGFLYLVIFHHDSQHILTLSGSITALSVFHKDPPNVQ